MKSYRIMKNMERLDELSELTTWLLLLRQYKFLIISIFIIAFGISFYLFSVNVSYHALATFAVNDWQANAMSENKAGEKSLTNKDEIITLFFSDDAINHLIQHFNLNEDLKPGDTLEAIKLRMGIASAISIQPGMFNSYQLSVVCDDRYLCADMANELIQKVQQLNTARDKAMLQRQIDFLDDLKSAEYDKQTGEGTALEERIQKAIVLIKRLGENERQEARNIQVELLAIMNDLQSNYLELNQQKYFTEAVLNAVSNNEMPSITLIRKALPDYTKYFLQNLFYSFLLALSCVLILPLFLYLFSKYDHEWKESILPDEAIERPELKSAK